MPPRISICIPAYRQVERLAVLFKSIEIQTFRDFEVVVTDDSPDNEVENLCRNTTSFKLHYFRNPISLGSPQNWNHAISKAEGEWIKLIHHDDYFTHPRALEVLLYATQENASADYIFSGTTIQNNFGGKTEVYFVERKLIDHIGKIPAYLFHKNLIGAPSTGFFKKTVSIIYDKELMWLVDIEYYARLLKLYKVSYVSDPLVTTVISDIQLTTQLKNNRNVEVREFLHCYCKLIGSMNRLNKKIMRSRLIYVLYHFDIRSQADIQSTGFDASIPVYANVVLFCMAIHRRLAYRVFCRLNYLNLEKLW